MFSLFLLNSDMFQISMKLCIFPYGTADFCLHTHWCFRLIFFNFMVYDCVDFSKICKPVLTYCQPSDGTCNILYCSKPHANFGEIKMSQQHKILKICWIAEKKKALWNILPSIYPWFKLNQLCYKIPLSRLILKMPDDGNCTTCFHGCPMPLLIWGNTYSPVVAFLQIPFL